MKRRTRKLAIENLQQRIVPASYADLINGTLHVGGAGECRVTEASGKITVSGLDINDNGTPRKSVPAGDVTFIEIVGDGDPNVIDLRTVKTASAWIRGNGGDDTINGTKLGDYIYGGFGFDFIHGENGDDYIQGDNGDDTIYGDEGGDEIHGNEGRDYIEGNEGRVIHASHGQVITYPNYLYGETEKDTIISASSSDYMYGNEEDDSMVGNGGDDYMEGNDGDDTMYGGQDEDFMIGGEGDDIMGGDEDDDRMHGQAGDDQMEGGSGDDHMDAGEDNDSANGDEGDDVIELGEGNDLSNGGNGNDEITAGEGDDNVNGENGHDTIELEGGNDTATGGTGNDEIDGGAGDDDVRGGAGHDAIDTGIGNDNAMGEAGNDTLEMGGDNDLADGGAGNDEIIGGEGIDILNGLDGNDVIEGEGGPDAISGGPGNDRIEGGEGDDLMIGDEGRDFMVGGAGRDTLDGGRHRDNMHGDEEGENEFDTTHFDTYRDAFKLAKPVFGKAAVSDIAMQDPHLEATLLGLGATVAKLGSKEFLKNLTVISDGQYDVKLEGEANPRRVAFDGTWTDNDPAANAEERLLSANSGTEKLEFWTILFARARLAKYNVDPIPFHTDAEWNSANAGSTNKLFDAAEAYHDYSPVTTTPSHDLGTLTFTDLTGLFDEHAAVIVESVAGTGLTPDQIEKGSGYVVVDTFKAGGKEWVKLYNVTGHDAEPHGTIVDGSGKKKDDGFITIEFSKLTSPANFAELHAWL